MNRRRFVQLIGGLFVAAPAVVRAASLMPIVVPKPIQIYADTGTVWGVDYGADEDISDMIYRITPKNTPFMQLGAGLASVKWDWHTDTLVVPGIR